MAKQKEKTVILWQVHAGPQEDFIKATEFEVLMGGGKGSGKASWIEDQVITPFGPKRMGDIHVGSLVSNPDGSNSQVIAVYPQGECQLYKVTFSDGASCTVTGDHLWLAKRVSTRRYAPFEDGDEVPYRLFTTEKLAGHLDFAQDESVSQITINLLIPLTCPVEFTRAFHRSEGNEPLIDPYVLGVLIGDGGLTTDGICFSSDDEHIVEEMRRRIDCDISNTSPRGYRIVNCKELKDRLSKLSLWGKYSYEKHIPEEYRIGSLKTRWEIVNGLMDAYGTVDKQGHASFCSTSEQLANDMQFVLRSLGFNATKPSKKCSYRDDNGNIVPCRDAYTLYIQGKNQERLFSLPRKIERCVGKPYNNGLGAQHKRIKSIEPVGTGEAQCIKVDHPNGLYLTNDFIVTHNSQALMIIPLLPHYLTNENFRGLLMRRTYPRLLEIRDRCDFIYKRIDPGCSYNKEDRRFVFSWGSSIRLMHCEHEEDKWNVWGQEFSFLGLDQIEEFTETQYEIIRQSARSSDPKLKPIIRMTANPGASWVKERFVDVAPWGTPYEYEMPDGVGGKIKMARKYIHATVLDNPTMMKQNPEYYGILSSIENEFERKRAFGDWEATPKAAFEEFHRERHVKSLTQLFPDTGGRPPEGWTVFATLDWGYTSPFAIYWHCLTSYDKIMTFAEYYGIAWDEVKQRFRPNVGIKMLAKDVAKAFLQKSAGLTVSYMIADKSMWWKSGNEAGSIGQEWELVLAEKGIPMIRSDNSPGSRAARKMQTHTRLSDAPDGSPWWLIADSCVHLIRTLPTLPTEINPNKPDEILVDTTVEDHGFDSASIGFLYHPLTLETDFKREQSNIIGIEAFRNKIVAASSGYGMASTY